MTPDLEGREVLVLGLGVSGISGARFCAERGARVTAADEREAEQLGDLSELGAGVTLRVGLPFPDPSGFDLLVPSPGVASERYARRSADSPPAWGDVELAFRALRVPVVAVTGTNGKSTTVRLIEAMLRACGLRARAAGNVGTPALSLVGESLDVAVLEVSSFQLDTTERFRPRVAVVLNVTPDHLDRYGSFEAYLASKARILRNQEADDAAVLHFGDPAARSLAAGARARIVPFGPGPFERGAWLDAGAAVLRDGHGTRRLSLDGLTLVGRHNQENVLAALAAVWASGADPERALAALPGFSGLRHRCEIVCARAGVTWIDDSKATNPAAAVRSLESFAAPVVWIAGGRDKGLDFAPLVDAAAGRARRALLIGESAEKLELLLAGRVETERLPSLEAAVERAAACARAGDVVLLAPGCASLDQFRSFEERGERFRAAVLALGEGGAR